MTPTEIILSIYRNLIDKRSPQGIPVNLRAKAIVGTVQDDPFDCRVENEIKSSLPKNFDVYHSGALTTPDLVIRDRKSGLCVGLEIKKTDSTTQWGCLKKFDHRLQQLPAMWLYHDKDRE